jgi:hypothetical protein
MTSNKLEQEKRSGGKEMADTRRKIVLEPKDSRM